MSADKPPLKPPSPQEWEALIDDFQNGRETAWTSNFSVSSILDLSLSSILKRDFPISLKHSLILFIEEYAVFLFADSSNLHVLNRLVETLRALVQAPVDPLQATYALKEQMMVSTTSIFISLIDGFDNEPRHEHHLNSVESLVELLLAVINRPNHGLDRQTRAIASECLRELEKSFPCLLSDIAGHLWSLCQSERTHASQCYILLFTQVIHSIVVNRVGVSILNTSVPLVPFNVPQWVLGRGRDGGSGPLNCKELRRAMAFLLEWPHVFSPCGMLEFMGLIMPVAVALELQASMLKVQFFGMVYSYDPILCHVVLRLYMHFLDAFNDQEGEIAQRLVSISREAQCPLVFRLLSLHWLLGFFHGSLSSGLVGKRKLIAQMGFSFYPGVFDALSLKILKLDLLALCSMCVEDIKSSEGIPQGCPLSAVKIFDEGLVSVSAFKWMPPWSTETAVAFRTFHKFLMGASSHSENDFPTVRALIDSPVFRHLQEMLVELMLEFERLVPVVVAFIDRLSVCKRHFHFGECLLQTLDEKLLPKVTIDYDLVAYFPIFDKIAENQSIPPRGLLELLLKLMIFIVKKHGPDTELRSWSQGSKVLGIGRTMMMHHHSSRLFVGLSKLLAFTSLYFPDLEVRDNARIYLRMLICVPGRKLRGLLNLGEQLPVIAPSAQPGSYFSGQSPRLSHDPKKSRDVLAYMHLERRVALLVKQSWSLSLSTLGLGNEKPDYIGGIKDTEQNFDDGVTEMNSNVQEVSEIEKVNLHEPLRVMDSKLSEMLITLRKHFSCIPDFRHMVGIKVKISCILSFESSPFCQTMGFDSPVSDEVDALPAIYATVLRFSSSSPYGSIPSYHIPFLLGNPQNNDSLDSNVSLHIVPVGKDIHGDDNFRAPVTVELEPREPTPGLVDVFLETNAENGQIIRGQLHGITVGIEDMFLNAVLPPDIDEQEVPLYKSDLFTALWEGCGNPSNFGREIFPLKGGKGVAAINGTQSVKLLEVPSTSLILRTERYLASFVVTVIGAQLVDHLKGGGIINDVIWKDSYSDCLGNGFTSATKFDDSPLRLKYIDDEDESENYDVVSRRNLGCIHIMIFLPPRFHLLLQMEVCDVSTLVRIRTDHWPCLAYIDDYLEALYLA